MKALEVSSSSVPPGTRQLIFSLSSQYFFFQTTYSRCITFAPESLCLLTLHHTACLQDSTQTMWFVDFSHFIFWKQPFPTRGSLSLLCSRYSIFYQTAISICFTAFSGKRRLLSLCLFHTHFLSASSLCWAVKKHGFYVRAPAQGAVYCGDYSNSWVIALQESLGLEHTQRKGRGGGVFRRWCTRGGDTALCLCECV